MHLAVDCLVFVDDSCCVERGGKRCAVLGSVVYDELLATPSAPVPAAAVPNSHPVRRCPHFSDLVSQLDEPSNARRVRQRRALATCNAHAWQQCGCACKPSGKRSKRYGALLAMCD